MLPMVVDVIQQGKQYTYMNVTLGCIRLTVDYYANDTDNDNCYSLQYHLAMRHSLTTQVCLNARRLNKSMPSLVQIQRDVVCM